MTRKLNFLCTLSLLVLVSTLAVAQPNANPTSENSVMQATEANKGKFPEAPNDMWELGLSFGHAMIGGDIQPNIFGGFGVGFHARKALNYTISMRGGYTYHQMTGENFYVGGITNTGNYTVSQLAGVSGQWIPNYKTTLHQVGLETLFNLSNLKFHKSTSKWGIYAGIGANYHFYDVAHDVYDSNGNQHDVSTLVAAIAARGDVSRDDRSIVKGLLDNDYETAQENDKLFSATKGIGVNIPVGISYKISDKMNISFENNINFSVQDNLDGYRSPNPGIFNDAYSYTNIRLNFNVGDAKKQTQPLYWLNPLDQPYDMIASNTERLDNLGDLLADADGDGVPDKLDKEQNSPAGAIVNTKGETIDSDGDGVADYLDKEPFSEVGAKVDGSGINTAVKPSYVTKADIDKMAKEGNWVNEKTQPVTSGGGSASNWFLPMIHFDNGSAAIKPSYYSQLHHVATVMQKNPSLVVVVDGHASSTASVNTNLDLSKRRAENAAKFLMDNYGISSSRLIIKYEGEAQPLKGSSSDSYMNRRVEFSVSN